MGTRDRARRTAGSATTPPRRWSPARPATPHAGARRAVAPATVRHVLLEGGPTLAGAFLRAGLVDEVVAYVAPMLLGAGRSGVGDLGVTTIADALRLDVDDVTVLGAGRGHQRPAHPDPAPKEDRLMFTGIVEELGEVGRDRRTRATPSG